MRRFIIGFVVVAACAGGDPGPDPIASTGDTGGVSPPAPASPYVRELRVNAYLGWDAEAAAIVDATIDGVTRPSVLVLELSAAPGAGLEDCSVTVELAPLAVETPDGAARWQLDVPAGDSDRKVVVTDCPDKGYDDAQYPGQDALSYWGALPWTLRVVGADLAPTLEAALPEQIDPTFVLQGELEGEEPYGLLGGPLGELSFWRGFAMSEGTVATAGGELTNPLMASEVASAPEGTLPTGYYIYDDLVVTPLPDQLVRGAR